MSLKLKLAKYSLLFTVTTLINLITLESPTIPAESINFNYSLLGFEVKVADLELFATQGKITKNLNFYLKRISPEQRKKLQQFLTQSYEVNPVLVYRYSRTSVGIKLLERIGKIIQIPHDINGFYGLRAAVVLRERRPTDAPL
ncbi:MAG: alpha/beta hydrolase [Cyanobacteria bacterium P01_F01_bin.143]